MGLKVVAPVCCVKYLKETTALIIKKRGCPQCSWVEWQHIAPQHFVNHYNMGYKGTGLILQKIK
jgi:hypothetical protein